MVRKVVELKYAARRHDKASVAHLLSRPFNGVLSDPGCGKTGQVLAAFHVLRSKRLIDRMLVLGPINAVHESWPGEIAAWGFPYEMTVLHGTKKDRLLAETDSDVYGVNFDGLRWLADNCEALLAKGKRWWLVVDESHNMRDSSTQRFKALKPLLPLFGRRTVLTGTPRPQDLEDLFGQAYIVDLGEALGKYVTHFRRDYFFPSGYGGYSWTPQPGAEKKVYKKLSGMFFRVDERVLDLPPLHDVPVWVRLGDEARAKYKELEREFVLELKAGTVTAANSGIKTGKLRQVANGFVYAGGADGEERRAIHIHDEKVGALAEIFAGLGGSPVLVGYEFEDDGRRIAKALGGAPVLGDYSPAKRRGVFADFNAGRLPALVAQWGAASESLNLQEACQHVALFGLPWKAKDYTQFRKRVHRSGQRRAVTVHHLLARDTIDDRYMWPVLQRRGAEQADFFKYLMRAYGK